MVWAGISAQGKTDLHVIENGTLTALRYVNEILDVYVRPYAGAIGENFILMDDNARAHRARITDQYLEQATIVRMEWPARSPDLNPVEHAWDMLQTAVSSRPVQPASVQELKQALLEEWDQIPQYKIRRLISSMRRRCQAGNTRFLYLHDSTENVDFLPLRPSCKPYSQNNTGTFNLLQNLNT